MAPGQYRSLPWITQGPKESQEGGKPVLLYVYDLVLGDNNPKALFYETFMFDEPAAKKALESFNFTLVATNSNDWPKGILDQAKGGVAIFVLNAEGQQQAMWNTKTPKEQAQAFTTTVQRVADAYKKKGPPKPAPGAAPAEDDEGKDPKDGKKKKDPPHLPGLTPAKDDPNKKPPEKKKTDKKDEE